MSEATGQIKRKLIEVALPLTEISKASRADKDRKVGTIKNVHKWFAPMPTPALRALIFAALVDDPEDERERQKLLDAVKTLVPEDGTPPTQSSLNTAMAYIHASNPQLPTVLDPFAGGASTLVEAQRLGLPVFGSDLNPVAALITRTLAELVPPMADAKGIYADRVRLSDQPYDTFIDDLRHYGGVAEEAVKKRLGSLYPNPDSGQPVAWLWARTAPCTNPACGLTVPLFGSPWLSKQKGRETSIEAVPDGARVRLVLHRGKNKPARSTKGAGRANFHCPGCGTNIGEKDLRMLGTAGKLGLQLMALCIDTSSGRTFLDAAEVEVPFAEVPIPDDFDDLEIGTNTKNFSTPLYGLNNQSELYTPRQLAMMAAFADEVANIPARVIGDGGSEAQAIAIASVLGLCLGKLAQSNSSLVRWFIDPRNGAPKAVQAFGTQAIPMLWDFAECNPFGNSVGSWRGQIESVLGGLRKLPTKATAARVIQADARQGGDSVAPGTALLVTDPPYFGQINYADLSDYFYVWLRRALAKVHPDLFPTLATPKSVELVANPARHGGNKDAARQYFIDGFTEVFSSLRRASRPDLPIVVVYAHKQDEKTVDGVISTGWESLLEAVLAADLGVVGTWPVEATHGSRQIGQGANALSSYVILICRPRAASKSTDRRGFIAALKGTLPKALRELQQANIAPVDLAQAAIGPGMAVFSRYAKVVEPDGSPMRVRAALAEINRALDEVLWEQEGDFDADTRFCIRWFTQYGWNEADSGIADNLSRATITSVAGLERGGIFRARARRARLLEPQELPSDWNPAADDRISVWEVVLQLAKALIEKGADEAARLMASAAQRVDMDAAKELAYLLFSICEKRGWTQTALLFNGLGTSRSDLSAAARTGSPLTPPPAQGEFDFSNGEE